MVANHIIADQFIQNLKINPSITDNNGKIENHGRTYANNVVALEPGWIRDNFEFL